jgi:hypothetical protein
MGPKGKNGMLPWKWAQEELADFRKYLMMTCKPMAAPHDMTSGDCGSMAFGSDRAVRRKRHVT